MKTWEEHQDLPGRLRATGRMRQGHTAPQTVPVGTVKGVRVPAWYARKRILNSRPCPASRAKAGLLLDLDFGADVFKFLLDRRRFVLVDAFLDWLGRAVHQI